MNSITTGTTPAISARGGSQAAGGCGCAGCNVGAPPRPMPEPLYASQVQAATGSAGPGGAGSRGGGGLPTTIAEGAFARQEQQQVGVELDSARTVGGQMTNLARLSKAMHERVDGLGRALAKDANVTGVFNPVDMQRLELESRLTSQADATLGALRTRGDAVTLRDAEAAVRLVQAARTSGTFDPVSFQAFLQGLGS